MKLFVHNQQDEPVVYRIMEKNEELESCVSQMQLLPDQSTVIETTERQWVVIA